MGDTTENDNINDYQYCFHSNGNQHNQIITEKEINAQNLKYVQIKKKHHKTKNGCLACKERKIKCDEKLPFCMNCLKKGIDCPYLTMTPYQIHTIIENQKHKNHHNQICNNKLKLTNNNSNNNNNNNNNEEENNYLDDGNIDYYDNTKSQTDEYTYQKSGSINLNNETNFQESIYYTYEIEHAILSSTMDNIIINNDPMDFKSDKNNTVISSCSMKKIDEIKQSNIIIPLSSDTRSSKRIFNTSHDIILNELVKFVTDFVHLTTLIINRDFKEIFKVLKGQRLDIKAFYNYIHNLSISQIYNKLLRKSHLLFAMDYYKNTILKQKILPDTIYKSKLSISGELEKLSVVSIDGITRIIKEEYLPYFNDFDVGSRNLFLASFIVLDDCLGYHFKNGLKYDMSLTECEKAIQLAGIFTTGMYAIIISRSNESLLMTTTNILSSYLIANFKKLLIPNYHIKIVEDFKNVIDKLSISCHSDVNYENLKIFCDQNKKLSKINIYQSIIGFDTSYVFKMYNSFKSILPFDLHNLLNETSTLSEIETVNRLAYFTLNELINSLIPGIKNFVAGILQSTECLIYDFENNNILMKLFKKIKNKKLQLIAIFLIRIARFLNCRCIYFSEYLANVPLDEILDDDENISIHERYLKLKRIKDGNIIDEIQMKTFLLTKGQFIRRWNYPNKECLQPGREFKVGDNKIMNYFEDNEDLLIQDFISNNNGFFSLDHNVLQDILNNKSVFKETRYINGNQMKNLWKLITYIRINNL